MKKKRYLENVRVQSPCTKEWNEMIGNDQIRFCSHCAKDVNNLSAMTRRDAMQLVRESNGQLCIRYIKHPETNAPMFSEQFVQISRRAPRVAAGVMSASLSLSTFAYAQGNSYQRPERPNGLVVQKAELRPVVQKSEVDSPAKAENIPAPEQTDSPENPVKVPDETESFGKISGTVVDPHGAVVPGISVTLRDLEGKQILKTTTGDEGKYTIDEIPFGSYVLGAAGGGFRPQTVQIKIREGSEQIENLSLDVLVAVAGGMIMTRVEYKGAIILAVEDDDFDTVRELIVAGEDVNRQEDDDTTPLFVAVERGKIAIVRLLLESGAKTSARKDDKQTPLMMLNDDTSVELVELLIQHGAKVNVAAANGDTPLIRAARETKPEVLRTLITAGAELNEQNDEGVSPLMNAADTDNLENVRVLLLAGADVNLRDKEGDNAWDYTGESEIENLLITHGVKLDPEDIEEPSADPEDGNDGDGI